MKTEIVLKSVELDPLILSANIVLDEIKIEEQSRLKGLFACYRKLGYTKDSIPILRMTPVRLPSRVNCAATLDFMEQVVEAGSEKGVKLFVGEEPNNDHYLEKFFDNRTKGYAIEMLLNHPPKGVNMANWNLRVMGTEAARSVVGRKIGVQSALRAHAFDLLEKDPGSKLEILSIASGWGRLPLDVMMDVNKIYVGSIKGHFIDSDQEAVEGSQKMAEEKGLSEQIEVQCMDFLSLLRSLRRSRKRGEQVRQAELIESTGLADYLEPRELSYLFEACRMSVSDNGLVSVTNIVSTREEKYLNIVWKSMHRRTPDEMAKFALANSFDPRKTVLVLDPTGTMCTIFTRPLLESR